MRTHRLLLPLALAAAAVGQGIVSPAHFAAVEGSYFANAALGSTDPKARFLQVHDDLKGAPRTLNALSFRRDNIYSGGNGSGGNRPAFSIVADVFLSTAAVPASAMSATFASNHGADRTQVATLRQYDFPAAPHFVIPAPWGYALPFSQSFAFSGGAGLCWQVDVQGRTNTGVINFDGAYGASNNPGAWTWGFGGACKVSGETQPMLHFSSGTTVNWTASLGSFRFGGYYLPKSASVLLGIGTSATLWNGVPLPFVLPGTATAASGECAIHVEWAIQVGIPTTAAGTADYAFPPVPVFHGTTVFSQLAAYDAAANPWGLVTSGASETHLVAPFPAPSFGTVKATSLAVTGNAVSYPLADGYVVKLD